MKEGAEKVELKIQAKVESLKHANEGDKGTKSFFRSNFVNAKLQRKKNCGFFFLFLFHSFIYFHFKFALKTLQ